MEQTKTLPPLVNRDRFAEYAAQYTYPTSREVLRALEKFADIHEAERSKLLDKITRLEGTTNFEVVPKEKYDRTREVAQALVDDLRKLRMEYGNNVGRTTQIGIRSLDLAKSQLNIEPTKP